MSDIPERVWRVHPWKREKAGYHNGLASWADKELAEEGSTEYIRADLAAQPTPTREQTWQPIETAPKDGTRILVSCVYDVQGEIYTHEWVDYWYEADILKGWYNFPKEFAAPFRPTHWMPLPTPPALDIQEGE